MFLRTERWGFRVLSAAMGRSSSHLLVVRLLLVFALVATETFPTAGIAQNQKTRTTKVAITHSASYPKLRLAISSLESAKAELQRADGDFGGHKKDALESIDNALKQMRLALQFEKY